MFQADPAIALGCTLKPGKVNQLQKFNNYRKNNITGSAAAIERGTEFSGVIRLKTRRQISSLQ